MNKLLVLLVIMLVLTVIFVGCSGGTTTAPATTTAPPAATTSAPVVTTSKPAATTQATIKPPTTTTTIAAVTTPPATTGTQKRGGLVRTITGSGPGAPFGAIWLSNGTSVASSQYSIEFPLKEKVDGSLVPNLATSWDVVTDPANPSVTLHLRKGVKFSDGTDFNAQAVKWNLEMCMKGAGSTYVGATTNWKSIEIIDDSTLKINLKNWQNTALRSFADSVSLIASPASYEKKGVEWMSFNCVGTGPFLQTDFQRDVVLKFERNPNYWQAGKPYIDKLENLFVTDAMTAEALFKSGGAEIIQAYDAMMARNLQNAGFKIFTMPGMGSQIWPDSANADSPWANVKVRMAAEYALDKEGMARTFGYGASQASYQSNPPTSMAYDDTLVPRKYDVAKAKQLLTEAGYPNGFKTNIYVAPFGGDKNIATAIQANWNAVGIKAELQYPQAGAWSGMLTGKWTGGVLYGAGPLSANPNSGWALTYTEGSAWFGSLKRPDGFYDLFKASITAPNLDPVLLKKCEAALFNDCNTIPLSVSLTQWAVRDEVMDHGLGTRGMFAWWEPQDTWLNK